MIRAILTFTFQLGGIGPANDGGRKLSKACYFEGHEDGSMDEDIEKAVKETLDSYRRFARITSHCLVMVGDIYGGEIVYVDMNDRSVHELNSKAPSA